MLGKRLKKASTLALVVTLAAFFCSMALAADFPFDPEDRAQVPLLYAQLSHNIEKEATLYSSYIDYQQDHRLQNFWRQLKALNFTRDELIQTIALLEQKMSGQMYEAHATNLSTRLKAIVISTQPDLISQFFSHWRPFYFLISGGFLLIMTTLLIVTYYMIRRPYFYPTSKDDLAQLAGYAPYGLDNDDMTQDKKVLHKKAA